MHFAALVEYEVDIHTTDALPSDRDGCTLLIALSGSMANTNFIPLDEEMKDGSDESLDVS